VTGGWSEVFLAVIAVATLVMAIVQIGVIVAASRMARRVEQLVDRVDREMKPLFGNLNAISAEAARAASLATAQVERADKLFADVAARVNQAMNDVQASIGTPAREGRAIISGFKAALQALRDLRAGRSRGSRAEDEDALFI
jgi:uncharacterized protein YoxC